MDDIDLKRKDLPTWKDIAWWRRQLPILLIYAFCICMFILIGFYSPSFTSYNNLRNIIQQAAILGVAAIGQTLIIMTGGIDLSIPGVMGVAGVLLVRMTPPDGNIIIPFIIVLGIAVLVGLLNGIGVGIFKAPPIIMTLGMNTLLGGLLVVTAKGVISGQGTNSSLIRKLAIGSIGPFPIAGLFWLLLIILVTLVLWRTSFGRKVYAIGSNPQASEICGVNVPVILIGLYIISACTSAISGWMLSGYLSQAYASMGDSYLFISITAVLVGGVSMMGGSGNYLGTVAGTIALTIISGFLVILNLGSAEMRIINGLIIFATVALSKYFQKIRTGIK